MKVSEFLDNWINTYGKFNLKLTTRTEYSRHINQYIVPRIGNLELSELKPLNLQMMYYDVLENGRVGSNKPLNEKTVLQTHRIIHKALKSAVMLQEIKSNPADFVELPRVKKYKYNVLLGDDLKEFINSFKDTVMYYPVLLAVSLGLRRGELLALTFKDINFIDKTVSINKSLVNSKGVIKIDTTKNESSNRVLLLSDNVISIFKILNKNNTKYVITNRNRDRYNPGSFSRLYTSIRDTKGLPKIRFHDLRHIHATVLYKSGIKTKVIQERLGHSNISTTLDIYTHLFKDDQQEVLSIIDNIL